jgi:hypothetical protein
VGGGTVPPGPTIPQPDRTNRAIISINSNRLLKPPLVIIMTTPLI